MEVNCRVGRLRYKTEDVLRLHRGDLNYYKNVVCMGSDTQIFAIKSRVGKLLPKDEILFQPSCTPARFVQLDPRRPVVVPSLFTLSTSAKVRSS